MFDETNFNIEKSLILGKLSKLREYQKFLKELQTTPIEDLQTKLQHYVLRMVVLLRYSFIPSTTNLALSIILLAFS